MWSATGRALWDCLECGIFDRNYFVIRRVSIVLPRGNGIDPEESRDTFGIITTHSDREDHFFFFLIEFYCNVSGNRHLYACCSHHILLQQMWYCVWKKTLAGFSDTCGCSFTPFHSSCFISSVRFDTSYSSWRYSVVGDQICRVGWLRGTRRRMSDRSPLDFGRTW